LIACVHRVDGDDMACMTPIPSQMPLQPAAAAAPLDRARYTVASRMLLLADPAVEWARRLAMIREARRFVHLVTYYVDHDRWALELLDELDAARRRGVAVLLGIDTFGQRLNGRLMSRGQRADLRARLAALGPAVRFYRPASRLQRVVGAGQHIKIQLSETGEALHGSSNISRRSFDPAQWKEVSFSLWGSAALAALDTIAALFPGAVPDDHRALVAAAAGEPGTVPLEYWWHDPNRSATPLAPAAGVRNPLTQRLMEAIDAARSSIRATSFYFKPCALLAAAFARAARRGVAVEIFHSHRGALVESALPWMAAAADYRRWHAAGVTIHESARGEHSKLLLVDDAELAIGSYNFEHAAHDRLAELMVFVRDAQVVAQACDLFDGLRADPDNQVVDAAAFARVPWSLRGASALFSPMRRWI
jgi:phosphatidylserine/phosphatidylglycerophosphate/cardiolipin synthase-like enzyme